MNRLFSATPAYSSLTSARFPFFRYKVLLHMIKWSLIIVVIGIFSFFVFFRIDTHLRIYLRQWLLPPKAVIIEPLFDAGSCYSGDLAPIYRQGYKMYQVDPIPGFRLQDDTCFGYAATILDPIQHALSSSASLPPSNATANAAAAEQQQQQQQQDDDGEEEGVYFHTHYRSSTEANRDALWLATLRSFVATQHAAVLIVWVSKEDAHALNQSAAWRSMEKYVDRILRYEIITGEPVAFEALSKYGGLWFDIHTLFVRDLSPLLESGNDWMSQATCFTSVDGNPFLGSSMMYFRKHSPHLCELKHAAGAMRGVEDQEGINAGELYYRVYQRILRNGYEPWAVMPWCYVDPSQCRKPNRLQSPFDPSASFDRRMLESVFAYHYHTLPSSSSRPTGAIYNYLDGKYAKALNR